jgi:hypothetical protein
MNPEHVKLSASEIAYGQKWLLESQLGMMESLKREKKFKDLRADEFAQKIALKTRVEEILLTLDVLDKILPRPTMKENKERISDALIQRERPSLEQEIEDIKRKLSRLQF